MIKTHSKSRFQLKTLEEIRDSAEIVLQIERPTVHLLTAKRRLIFAKSSIREITERHQRLNRWRKSLSKRITIIGRFTAGSQSWKQSCERRVRVNE